MRDQILPDLWSFRSNLRGQNRPRRTEFNRGRTGYIKEGPRYTVRGFRNTLLGFMTLHYLEQVMNRFLAFKIRALGLTIRPTLSNYERPACTSNGYEILVVVVRYASFYPYDLPGFLRSSIHCPLILTPNYLPVASFCLNQPGLPCPSSINHLIGPGTS